MLSIANKWLHSFFGGSKKAAGKPIKVIMTGLHSVGKTTTLYKYASMVEPNWHMVQNERITYEAPVIGFNLNIYKSPWTRLEVTEWDTPEKKGNRYFLRRRFTNLPHRLRSLLDGSEAFVFVVDTDSSRKWIEEEELHWYLNFEELRGVPLLVLANMTAVPYAMPLSEIRDSLGLTSLEGQRRWRLHGVCARPGTGLPEAFEWISAGCLDLRLATPWHDLMLLRSLYVRGRASIKECESLKDVM